MGKRNEFVMTSNAHNKCHNVKHLLKLVNTKRRFWQLTMQDLGDLCGMSKTGVQTVLSGTENSSYSRASMIARALGIKTEIRAIQCKMPKDVKKIMNFNRTKTKQATLRSEMAKAARRGIKIMEETDRLEKLPLPPTEYKD